MTLPFWTIWLIMPVCFVAMGLVVWLEKRYYDRHPEKERPDPSPWP
jgi:ATP/ADP translocase